MASGCIPVVPNKGGTDEFAIPDFNSVVVDTTSIEDCIKGIGKLIQADSKVLLQLKLNAIETAAKYSPKRAALSIYNLFYNQLLQRAS
jgi:signal transduction histidine kinase